MNQCLHSSVMGIVTEVCTEQIEGLEGRCLNLTSGGTQESLLEGITLLSVEEHP